MAKTASSQLLSDSQRIGKPEPVACGPAALGEAALAYRREGAVNSRFAAFREILLTALRDLESIGADSQPSVLKFRLRDEVRRFEIDLICAALQKTNGNQKHAAMLLGTNATTLQCKIKRYKITIRRSHLDNVITE